MAAIAGPNTRCVIFACNDPGPRLDLQRVEIAKRGLTIIFERSVSGQTLVYATGDASTVDLIRREVSGPIDTFLRYLFVTDFMIPPGTPLIIGNMFPPHSPPDKFP